jgi:hypothetical protein
VVNFYIGKQKVVWILKLRENGWEAAASAQGRERYASSLLLIVFYSEALALLSVI